MAQKKAYSRYFIILQQDENGYSLSSDKLPSGYTKLETKSDKCKVTYYVQSLKKDLEPYYMVLIFSKKDVKKLVKLGMMNIDEHGRAEITYEYNTNSIAGSGLPIDLVTGAAVVKQEDIGLVSVMSGFVASDVPTDWRNFELYDESRTAEVAEENIESEKKIEIQEKQAPAAVVPENSSENVENQNTIFDEYEEKIEDLRQEKLEEVKQEKIEDVPVVNSSDESIEEEEIEADTVEVDSKKESIYSSQDVRKEEEETIKEVEYPIGTVGEFFRIVADDFEEVEDVCKEIKKCRWYKVKVDSWQDMCNSSDYNRYTIVYYPMMSYYPYIKNHGHYLLGYKYDEAGKMKYIVYGIPGTKNIQDQPFGGKSGFVTWVSKNEVETRDDEYGYWLMFYDFRTSTIVVPVKKS